jgi:hypothetical protein
MTALMIELLRAMKRLFALAALAAVALTAQGRWTQKFDVLLKRVDSLMADYKAAVAAIDWKRGDNDASGYSRSQRVHQELVAAFESASREAGESADAWIELAKRAPEISVDTRIRTAERAVQLRSNAETLLLLGQGLKSKHYWYPFSNSAADRAGLERACTVLRSAIHLSASKNPTTLYELGDCLKALYELDEAEVQFQLASRLAPNNDKELKKRIAVGLIMTAYLSSNKQLMESRFSEFADSGLAESGDWFLEAQWLQNLKDYVRSGETFLKAAALFNDWNFTCQAAQSFYFGDETDRALSTARDCILWQYGDNGAALGSRNPISRWEALTAQPAEPTRRSVNSNTRSNWPRIRMKPIAGWPRRSRTRAGRLKPCNTTARRSKSTHTIG